MRLRARSIDGGISGECEGGGWGGVEAGAVFAGIGAAGAPGW